MYPLVHYPKKGTTFLIATTLALVVIVVGLAGFKLVILKMLPFDNKSELQVVVNMPEGTTLEQTARVTRELGQYLASVPEVTHYQSYVGTSSPYNFNGLVRHYFLRSGANVADIQVNFFTARRAQKFLNFCKWQFRGRMWAYPMMKIPASIWRLIFALVSPAVPV